MKNGKKAISLALTALTVVSLSSCFDVSQKDKGEILTYDYNGTALKLTTEDIINKYLNEDRTEHAKAFYNALYEVVVRVSFEKGGLLANYKTAVESSAKDAVLRAKSEADSSGKSWHDYLVDAGYKDDNTNDEQKENEFYLDKLYSSMTDRVNTEFSNKFNKWELSADDPEQQKYNALWGEEGYLTNRLPYHVKHILVKVDASETSGQYSRGHISSANVDKLYKTVTRLVEGDSFSSVAKNFTDDEGSAEKGGEYVMDIETSFVNEFQLGLYTYDVLLNKAQYSGEKDFAEKEEKLHIPESVKNNLTNFGATYIPYGVIEQMNKVKDIEKKDGISVNEGDADYFPRNIYFNKYFQNRNVAFITDEDNYEKEDLALKGNAGYTTRKDEISGKEVYTDITEDGKYKTKEGSKFTTEESKLKNFKELTINGVTKNVLHDTDGNPILVVRNQESSGGIHFIVVERSAFDESDVHFNKTEYIAQGASESNVDKYKTALNEYYATTNPKDRDGFDQVTQKPYYVSSFPNVTEEINGSKVYIPKKTYVQTAIVTPTNSVYSRVSDYTRRIDDFKKNLDTMESVTQFSKYEWLNSVAKVEFNKDIFGGNVNELVAKYIETQKETISRNSEKTIQDRWYQYSTSIKKQTNERQYNLLPEILAADFGNTTLYQKDSSGEFGNPGYNPKYDGIK